MSVLRNVTPKLVAENPYLANIEGMRLRLAEL